MDYAEEVYVHYFVKVARVGPGTAESYACVKGEEVDLACSFISHSFNFIHLAMDIRDSK
jgi:hypothetical protein